MALYMCPVNAHDVGGAEMEIPLDLTERNYEYWERAVHAMLVTLVGKGHITLDEMRRGVEQLPADTYNSWGYYEKWAVSISHAMIERGLFVKAEWDAALGYGGKDPHEPLFAPGHRVSVLHIPEDPLTARPHLRTPGYVHGCIGEVERYCGAYIG